MRCGQEKRCCCGCGRVSIVPGGRWAVCRWLVSVCVSATRCARVGLPGRCGVGVWLDGRSAKRPGEMQIHRLNARPLPSFFSSRAPAPGICIALEPAPNHTLPFRPSPANQRADAGRRLVIRSRMDRPVFASALLRARHLAISIAAHPLYRSVGAVGGHTHATSSRHRLPRSVAEVPFCASLPPKGELILQEEFGPTTVVRNRHPLPPPSSFSAQRTRELQAMRWQNRISIPPSPSCILRCLSDMPPLQTDAGRGCVSLSLILLCKT